MTNRTVQGNLPGGGSGIRVSRPGYEVTDPNLPPKGIAFDSRWPAAMNVHMSGAATGPTTGGQVTTVWFGKTFPTPPLVIVAFTDGQGRYRLYSNLQDPAGSVVRTYQDRFTYGLVGTGPFSYYVVAP